MKVLEKKEDFKELISKGKVIVDFYADWCGPCKMLSPVLEEFSKENSDVEVVKVNVDNFQDLAMEYKVMTIPNLVIFEDGEVKNNSVGFIDKDALNDLVK
ncbi:MAG: thioredoxin [Bacilli bacterium]|nr:thioredoxin [Bacilli bacterium]